MQKLLIYNPRCRELVQFWELQQVGKQAVKLQVGKNSKGLIDEDYPVFVFDSDQASVDECNLND